MWNLLMGNTESATSDEDEMGNDPMSDTSNEVIRVFQPQKLRDELENGKIQRSSLMTQIPTAQIAFF